MRGEYCYNCLRPALNEEKEIHYCMECNPYPLNPDQPANYAYQQQPTLAQAIPATKYNEKPHVKVKILEEVQGKEYCHHQPYCEKSHQKNIIYHLHCYSEGEEQRWEAYRKTPLAKEDGRRIDARVKQAGYQIPEHPGDW